MKKAIWIPLAFAAAFFLFSTKKAFAAVVNGQQIRGDDDFGSGEFGANRGNRKHQGIDILADPDEIVTSPISGTITRFPIPYASDTKYKGIEIKNDQYTVKIFYMVASVKIGAFVGQGQKIGNAQDIASKYGPGMYNHIHIEVRETKTGKLIDPTNLFV